MPSWPIHIALANKLKNKYNFTDDFVVGNIMPDATNGFIIRNISNIIRHQETHFNFQWPNKPPKNDVQKFLDIYQDKLNNPIILESLIHIITDNYYNEYTYKNHIKNIDGERFAILNDGSKTDSVTPWKLKQEDFKKFGDYLIFNQKLGNEINKTEDTINSVSDLTYKITNSDIDIIIDKINSFITRDVKELYNYKMFSYIELKKLFDECYKYLESVIENYLNNKKILVKGRMIKMLDKKYNHSYVEKDKYNNWKDKGYFESGDLSKKPYTIVIPPPNVTGKLHLGHAWDTTLQDIMIRYKKMDGYDTLWLPGMDHAAIATEAKVVQRLKSNGVGKYELGREKFLDECWNWTHEYSDNIRKQWAKLGLALDYNKEAFTLDENLTKAVKHVFVTLYNEGLIYRGEKIINWDPVAKTALSNEEVIYKDDEGAFYHLKYFIENSDEYLEVATTRPETLFGDTAVAVNPEDDRYKHLIGKNVVLPVINKLIPIVGDEHADMEFGTGVVKITPAHDPNDFEVGNRHNLERIIVMNEDATMNEFAGKYCGMTREECREELVKDLTESGILINIEKMTHSVGHSERTDAVVEPYLSKQWFVKMRPLADRVLENQKDKDTKVNFVPSRFEKTMNHWMEITYDWCISRQLWWGHRIPAWYKDDEVYVGMEAPKGEGWVQDNDVLDTWFSSALWPFATLGWPEKTEDFNRYYPNDVLVTGYDIIPFWVNRMTFQGLKFTNTRPFKDCLIHGLIRDKQGRKMSKSLGNGVDPMDVIEEYGCDSLRYFLATSSAPGMDLRYDEEKVKSTWNFINKLWNASRFVLMNIEDLTSDTYTLENLSDCDKWILNKLNSLIKLTRKHMEKYEFNVVGSELYSFIWNDFCDWYIELSKHNMNNTTKSVLLKVLTDIFKLLHPFMPFVTEEIYSMLPIKDSESIMISSYPKYNKEYNFDTNLDYTLELITKVRKIKLENNIKEYNIYYKELDNIDIISSMLKLDNDNFIKNKNELNEIVIDKNVSILYDGSENREKELETLKKERERLKSSIARREKLLSNENYVSKAPAHIVEQERNALAKEIETLDAILSKLS